MSNANKQPTAPRLVLFDIDGTLMITRGASSRCMKRAGEAVFGPAFRWAEVTVGTLDPQIFAQLSRASGITETPEQRLRYEEVYLDELEKELHAKRGDILVMPGIERLVELLHQRTLDHGDMVLGVLTGNFRRAAELKLKLSGLGLERFAVITCAEDGATRDDLPRSALKRAAGHAGTAIDPANTFIIGDTPRDIQCARANSCTPVAVATGRYTVDQLRAAGGELVFESLENFSPLLQRMGLPID